MAQVFVRIRPSVTTGAPVPAGDAARENCVHATSRHSLAIAPPEGSQAYKSGDRGQTYAFTRVFDSDTPQDTYFESTTAPLVGGVALQHGYGGGGWCQTCLPCMPGMCPAYLFPCCSAPFLSVCPLLFTPLSHHRCVTCCATLRTTA